MLASELRFSASYASKYHNCHGSANLTEAIPGFKVEKKDHAMARDQGTALHKVLENIVNEVAVENLVDAYKMLTQLAEVSDRGTAKHRSTIIASERDYIIWWFGLTGTGPVIEHRFIAPLTFSVGDGEVKTTAPKTIRFLAQAVKFIDNIMEDGGTLETEATREVVWLQSKSKTTVDILIRQGTNLFVIDLKAGTTPVPAMNNEQLLFYAATFIESEKDIYLIILQDGNIEEWRRTRDQLDDWMVTIQESERAILGGDLSLNPGSYCTFCPANPRGRGDKGYPFCPAMIEVLYGAADSARDDETILEGDDDF